MRGKSSYVLAGQRWLSIARAAELLRGGTAAVRNLMADGSLEWRQSRSNSTRLVVLERQVLELRVRQQAERSAARRRREQR
jgi:hypothetical protein